MVYDKETSCMYSSALKSFSNYRFNQTSLRAWGSMGLDDLQDALSFQLCFI